MHPLRWYLPMPWTMMTSVSGLRRPGPPPGAGSAAGSAVAEGAGVVAAGAGVVALAAGVVDTGAGTAGVDAGAAGVEAGAAAMVGDTAYDMVMGKRAGLRAVGVAWGYHPVDELVAAGADAVAPDYPSLPGLLARLV